MPAKWGPYGMTLVAGVQCSALTGRRGTWHPRVMPPGAGTCNTVAGNAKTWHIRVAALTAEAGHSITVAWQSIREVPGDTPALPERTAQSACASCTEAIHQATTVSHGNPRRMAEIPIPREHSSSRDLADRNHNRESKNQVPRRLAVCPPYRECGKEPTPPGNDYFAKRVTPNTLLRDVITHTQQACSCKPAAQGSSSDTLLRDAVPHQ